VSIMYLGEKASYSLKLGEIYTVRIGLRRVFGSDYIEESRKNVASSKSSLSSSSKKSSNEDRAPRRPCVIWQVEPFVQVLIFSRFDDRDIHDPGFKLFDIFSSEYLIKRLIPVYPRKTFLDRRVISVASTENNKPAQDEESESRI